MSGFWVPPGKQRFVDPTTGAPLIGASVYHYIPGTSAPKDTFADQAETTVNQNPVILDANGECTIWGEGLFRQVIIDVHGVTQWDQVTGFLAAAGTVTFASPAEVLAGTRNDVVISPYALANSGALATPTATGAQVLAGTLNNVYLTPFALAQSGVILPVATGAEVAALSTNVKVITPSGLGASGVLGGAGSSFPSITAFGFVGDGVTDNQGHIAAMLASSSSLLYVPDGLYFIGGDGPTQRAKFQRRMWGPGKFLFADGYCVPGRFSYISVAPTLWPSQGVTGFFRDDITNVEGEWSTIGPGVRQSLTARYFEAAYLPHPIWLDVMSGGSGLTTMAAGALAAGAGSAALVSTDGLAQGQTVGLTPFSQDGVITDTVTIDTIVGNTITFHPNLTTNYPNLPPSSTSAGLAVIMAGHRTWAGIQYLKTTNFAAGAGDVYGSIARLTQNYVPTAGQRHVFNTSTIGLFGGDMNFSASSSGTYGTGWENQVNDHGADVAYAAFVDSFFRNTDVGARGAFWVGHIYQAVGYPVDVGNVFAGAWRFGHDFTRASLEDSSLLTANIVAGTSTATLASAAGLWPGALIGPTGATNIAIEAYPVLSIAGNVVTISGAWVGNYAAGQRMYKQNAGAALNLALGQNAIIFNSASLTTGRSSDPSGLVPTVYGNQTGDLIMFSGNDGISDFWEIGFNRTAPNNGRAKLRPTSFNTNVAFLSAATVSAGTGLVTQGGFGGGNLPMVQFGVLAGYAIVWNGAAHRFDFYENNALIGHVP